MRIFGREVFHHIYILLDKHFIDYSIRVTPSTIIIKKNRNIKEIDDGDENDDVPDDIAFRQYTDAYWIIFFIIFWAILIIIALIAFIEAGNPLSFLNVNDSDGNECGRQNNNDKTFIDLQYLYSFDIFNHHHTFQICVKECPAMRINTKKELYDYYKLTQTQLCRYDFNMSVLLQPDHKDVQLFDVRGPCPVLPIYKGIPVIQRCIPIIDDDDNNNNNNNNNNADILNVWTWARAVQFISDLYSTWPLIALMCFGALVLSIIMIVLIHWLTRFISWIICIFVTVTNISLTGILWWTYYMYIRSNANERRIVLQGYINIECTIYVLAITATFVMVFLIISICFLHSKLKELATIFEEARKCILKLPGVTVIILLTIVTLPVLIIFCLAVIICLMSALEVIPHSNYNWLKNTCKIVTYFIGLMWTSEFIFGCQQLRIAGAVTFWYFRKPPHSLIYYVGSIIKGSLLITVFKIPRLILTFFYTIMKRGNKNGSSSVCASCQSCGLKCCICCFWFYDKFIKYLNYNTYAVIAFTGKKFYPASVIAWNSLNSNTVSGARINKICDLILFFGKLAVATVCGLVSILILCNYKDIYFYITPCVFVTVFTFYIAHVILSLYETVIDILFLCVCEDRKNNCSNGRWTENESTILFGEEPILMKTQQTIELTPLTPINKQPFSS